MVVHETYRDAASGDWLSPADVRIEGGAENRRAYRLDDGAEATIGGIEKMSKSKRNTVDPDEIISTFGADTARWFVLSDSPPERDVIWTEEGVQGAGKFVQRLWRLVGELSFLGGEAGRSAPAAFSPAGARRPARGPCRASQIGGGFGAPALQSRRRAGA